MPAKQAAEFQIMSNVKLMFLIVGSIILTWEKLLKSLNSYL